MLTKDEEIAQHNDSIKVLTERLKELGVVDATKDIASKHRSEDEAESLYDRMTPAEVMELYQTDREKWQEMMDAKEQAGLRKLFGGRR